MKSEISLIKIGNIFRSQHKIKLLKILEGDITSKVNSKNKRLKAYTRDNFNMSKISKILDLMKHMNE